MKPSNKLYGEINDGISTLMTTKNHLASFQKDLEERVVSHLRNAKAALNMEKQGARDALVKQKHFNVQKHIEKSIRMKTIKSLLLINLVLAMALLAMAADYDVVINNGRGMDPETKLDAVRNVGIKGGRIQVVTDTKISGKETVDAKGACGPPGFIDLHVHGQDDFSQKVILRDGVTSPLELASGSEWGWTILIS